MEIATVRRFIEEGIAFESTVRSSAEAIAAGEIPLIDHNDETVLLGIPVVENQDLGLFGSPDGVWVGGGAMAPVEVKSHRNPTRLDEIELCFYWDLLSPWRESLDDPAGLLILPGESKSYRLLNVELTDERFTEMRELVEAVRRARSDPPKSRICSCLVCSRIESQRVLEECRVRGDLTLLSGVGRKYARVLEESGIADFMTLRHAKSEDIVSFLQDAGYWVSEDEATAWIHHAESFERAEPVFFGLKPFDHPEFIALDLEYDTWEEGNPLWLAGAEVVTDGRRETFSFWADPGEERPLLHNLSRLLADYPDLPVVTWNGRSADLPQLRKACKRWRLTELIVETERRHEDLYLYVKESIRFPIERLKLKPLGAQLGLVRDPQIPDGLEATVAWSRYKRLIGTASGNALRDSLVTYNAQDVTGLTETAIAVRDLTLAEVARKKDS